MSAGFTYDGHHSDEYGVYLRAKPMDLVSQSRSTEFAIPGRPGRKVVRTEADVRTVKLQLDFTNRDNQEGTSASIMANLEALAALIDPEKGDRALTFDDRPGRKLMAQLEGQNEVVRQILHGTGEITMRATAPPYWLGNPRTVSWSTTASGQSMVLMNAGTKETPFKVTVRARALSGGAAVGVGASPQFWLLTVAGKSVGFNGALTLTDVLEVDTGALTVTLNGQNALNRWTGGFPKLPPGAVTLRQTGYTYGAIHSFDLDERYT